MKRIAAALAVFALLTPFLPANALAGGPPDGSHLSNVELMQLTVRGSVLEALNDLPLEGTEPIRIRSESPSEIDWFVENEVAGVLRARGAGLRLAPSPRGTVSRRSPGKKKDAVIVTEAEYDVAPVLTASEGIPYPGEACREGLEGSVTVELLLNEAGSVANVIVEESTGESFESVVAEGVQAFRFTPAEVEGEKVPARVRIRFDFPAPGDDCAEAVVEGKLLSGAEEETPETPAAEEEAVTDDGGTGAPQAAPEGEKILSYRVSEMEFRYPRVFRRFWFRCKRGQRFDGGQEVRFNLNGSAVCGRGSSVVVKVVIGVSEHEPYPVVSRVFPGRFKQFFRSFFKHVQVVISRAEHVIFFRPARSVLHGRFQVFARLVVILLFEIDTALS